MKLAGNLWLYASIDLTTNKRFALAMIDEGILDVIFAGR